MTKSTTIKWENISITSPEFLKAESEQSLTQFFHEYFSKNSIPNPKFLAELADQYPQVLINSIRVNRAFLKSEHFSSFAFLKTHSNDYCKNHYSVFAKIAEHEKHLYDSFTKASNKTNNINVVEVFCWTSLWFENKRAEIFESQDAQILSYDMSAFIEVVNFFINFHLFENKNSINNYDLKKDSDWLVWPKVFKEAQSLKEIASNPIWEALDKAEKYLYFLQGTINSYSFDLNFDITVTKDLAELKYVDENKLRRWYIENEKLKSWYDYNQAYAQTIIYHKLQDDPTFLAKKTGLDYALSYATAVNSIISQKVADEFCIGESSLGGVPSQSILKVLHGFVSNSMGRYTAPMDQLNYSNPKLWLQNIDTNMMNFGKQLISAIPTLLFCKSDFLNIISKNEESDQNSEQITSLISSDIIHLGHFDKLNPQINLTGKPFIKIKDFYLALTGVLGETSLQVNFLINTMQSNKKAHSQVESKEVEKMESNVKEMFQNGRFPNVICTKDYCENNKRLGNFDVVAYENGVLLLIELKRSKIRVHLSEAYDEMENSLKKASDQLDRAYKYISENFEKCKNEYFKDLNIKESNFSKIKIYPIIISTSFENDHTLIKGKNLKISFFEFQRVLENEIEMITSNRLESFAHSLISNNFWESLETKFDTSHLKNQSIQFKI